MSLISDERSQSPAASRHRQKNDVDDHRTCQDVEGGDKVHFVRAIPMPLNSIATIDAAE